MDNDLEKSIEGKLYLAWRQERRFIHLRGAARLTIWLIALIALSFLIDWGLFNRPGSNANIGLILLVVNVGVLGWALWHEWLRYLKPFDPVLVALEVEERHPELASLLVSYTQIDGPTIDQPNVSAELIAAMRNQAVEVSRPLDFREIVNFAQLKKLLIVACSVLLLFSILSIGWSGHFGALMKRLAGMNARYPTKTTVVEVWGDLKVRIGSSARVGAKAEGELPAAGRLFIKDAESEGDWKELPIRPGAVDGSYERELKGLTRDQLFYVRIGDDQSGEFRITVVPSPRVVETKVTLDYPAYLDRDRGESDQLNLEVPEGTNLRWTLKSDAAVKRLRVTTDTKSFDAEISEDGRTLQFDLSAKEAFKYTFHWTERASSKNFEYDDVQYSVRVVPDRLPDIELLRPSASGLATVKKTVRLQAKASDDHGLGKAWLVYSLDGSEEFRTEIHDFAGAGGQDLSHSWQPQVAIPELKPGAQITYAIEVSDRHPDQAGHLRRSATRQLSIVEPDTYLEWYRSELAAQTEELKRSRADEIVSSTKVKQIKTEEQPE